MSNIAGITGLHEALRDRLAEGQTVSPETVDNLIAIALREAPSTSFVEDRHELRNLLRFWGCYLVSLGRPLPDIDIDAPSRQPPALLLRPVPPDSTLHSSECVVGIGHLQSAFSEYLASADLRESMRDLGKVLPDVIEQQALTSRRSVPDIVHDLFDSVVQALEVNWWRPFELRLEQGSQTFVEIWVAAYPFLDHVDEEHNGMYQTVRQKLCEGARYVYFQPDRKYFDILRARLMHDKATAGAHVRFDEPDPECQLRFIEAHTPFVKIETFSIWNPNRPHDMQAFVLPPQQRPIKVIEDVGVWKVASRVTMCQIKDRAQAEVLYDQLEPLYKNAMARIATKAGRRSESA